MNLNFDQNTMYTVWPIRFAHLHCDAMHSLKWVLHWFFFHCWSIQRHLEMDICGFIVNICLYYSQPVNMQRHMFTWHISNQSSQGLYKFSISRIDQRKFSYMWNCEKHFLYTPCRSEFCIERIEICKMAYGAFDGKYLTFVELLNWNRIVLP